MDFVSPTECKRLVGELRGVLQGTAQVLNDQLKSLAGQYAAACKQVNQRLQRCQEFLNRGLRVEAIHLAQTPPDLLDLVGALDFPERGQWEQLVGLYNLAAAGLHLSTAQAVNEAYAQQAPLDKLLREHRRLALARAALPPRMQILRQLAQYDRNSLIWAEDLQLLEQAYFGQLGQAIEEARTDCDQQRLVNLVKELEQTPWLSPPPAAVLQAGRIALAEVTSLKCQQWLQVLVSKLQRDLRARDITSGRRHAALLNKLLAGNQVRPDDPLLAQAGPALDWLANLDLQEKLERQFKKALHDLAQAAATATEAQELEDKMVRLRAFNRPVPRELEQAYRRRLQEIRKQIKARERKIVLAVVAGFLFISACLVLWGYWTVQSNKYQGWVSHITGLLQEKRLEEAKNAFAEIERDHPGFMVKFEMRQLLGQHQEKMREESRRVGNFRKALVEFQQAPLEADSPPNPDQAEKLAKTPEEIQEIEAAKRHRQNRLADLRIQRDQEFQHKANALAAKLKKLESNPGDPALLESLDELDRDAEQLAALAKKVSREYQDRPGSLQISIGNLRLQAKQARADNQALAQLEAAFSPEAQDLGPFIALQEKYIKDFPSSSRAADFRKSLKHKELWLGLGAWSARLPPWQADPFPDDLAQAQERRQHVQDLLKAYPLPPPQGCDDYLTLLAGDVAKARAGLDSLMAEPLIAKLRVVISEEGQVFYYSTGSGWNQSVTAGEKSSVRYYVNFIGKPESRLVSVRKVEKAPQTLIAEEWTYLRDKSSQSRRQFEKNVVKLAEVTYQNVNLDPILQFVMLRKVLKLGGQGSPALALALDKQVKHLESGTVNVSAPWMDPFDEDARKARPLASKVLAGFPKLGEVLQEADKLRQQTFAKVSWPTYVPLGWLRKNGSDWQCASAQKRDGDAVLVIVHLEDQAAEASFLPVGSTKGGRIVLDLANAKNWSEGQVIFARKTGKNP